MYTYISIYKGVIIIKLLIVGSRSIKKFDLSGQVPSDTELIISGGADGGDTIAEQYANEHKISKLILYPRYRKYGKAAPIKRNELMVDISDSVIVLWDGKSQGTKYTIEYARKSNKPIKIIMIN